MTCYYTRLDQEALLHLSGPDALSFLQGQVTCDTRKLAPTTAMPGIYCTVKGRVVSDFLLSQLGEEHLVLRLRRGIRETAATAFAKYIVFSKAKLEPQRDDWQILACWGTSAAALLQDIFGASPSGKFAAVSGQGFTLVQTDDDGEQFECYLEQAGADAWQSQIKAEAEPAAETEWQALQIAAGIARIEASTSGEYIPQMLNYDLTGHISFNKGCYTGQEVIARLHYRGKSKRRLYPAEIPVADLPAGLRPAPGDPVYRDGEQAVGNVINCVAHDDRMALLITATSSSRDAGLRLLTAGGPSLVVGAAPYSIPQ